MKCLLKQIYFRVATSIIRHYGRHDNMLVAIEIATQHAFLRIHFSMKTMAKDFIGEVLSGKK